jgi:hypothetical protein
VQKASLSVAAGNARLVDHIRVSYHDTSVNITNTESYSDRIV